jgi:hypothetical protein
LADDASGVIRAEKRRSSAGTASTTPNAASSQPPARRTSSGASDSAPPTPPTSSPISVNVITMPSPIASGAARWRCTAPPTTTGSNGKTQGDNVVNAPATTLSAGWAQADTRQPALCSRPLSRAGSVSPVERPRSLAPWKTTSVDCAVTFICFSSAFSVS